MRASSATFGKKLAFEALNALVAVIGTAGQRAGRPRRDPSDEGGRTLLMFAWTAAHRANFNKEARVR